jgi:hypothetical protein
VTIEEYEVRHQVRQDMDTQEFMLADEGTEPVIASGGVAPLAGGGVNLPDQSGSAVRMPWRGLRFARERLEPGISAFLCM